MAEVITREKLPRDEYDRLSRVNWSKLKLIGKSPAHYLHALTERREMTDALVRGIAVHMACFEPERFRAECVVWDCGTRRGKEWEAFKARHHGQTILTEAMHATVIELSSAVRRDATATKYVSNGQGEVSVLWKHVSPGIASLPGYELDCKARLDFASPLAIADVKTCVDASPAGFGRAVANYEYHAQAAFYVDGYKAATGIDLPYVLIAVEAAPPHVVQVYRVPDEILELGRQRYRTLLDTLNHCRTLSTWPAYAEAELPLTLPRWATPFDAEEDAAGLDLVIG